ncbi:amidohydrolase family/endoribonuclease L-PSP [Hyphomonas neptunium ATCC 15444]|uniref:Amidohydrolase family/endoribonuclease L-PSP n=1 Tax=Hyphomonas neptunium (strain ATCC 15444) TaxID=228405 RepID=Q0BZ17_HYPNA|nr:amidohydrolase family/endoribonuclease L-PSP [Hyphomonas neptunium ATCC 15444]
MPVSWLIEGTSLMGASVQESFAITDGVARWLSQADSGRKELSAPALYAVNDGSPWADYVYARALLSDEDHRMPVLPGGEISLETVQEMDVPSGKSVEAVTVYRLSGIDMSPSLLALDADGALFATFSESSAVVRKGHEGSVEPLLNLARDLNAERTEKLAQRLLHRYGAPYSILNVRVLDVRDGSLSAPSVVTVSGNVITGVAPYVEGVMPEGEGAVFDAAGGTLMPGLADMHSHASANSGLYYLAAGVTSTRDMGNENTFLASLLDRMKADKVAGPRITPAGFIEGRSPFSARHGIIAASEEEALAAVDWYAEQGYGYVKSYNSMNPAWMPAVAERAHAKGMRMIGHIPAFTNADAMIDAGFDEVTHINQLMLGWLLDVSEDTRTPLRLTGMARGATLDLDSDKVQSTVRRMQENDTAIDPTAVILERLMLSRAGTVAQGDAAYLDHMPIAYQRYRRRSFVSLADTAEDEAYQEGFRRVLETLKMLHEDGITILPGTDDGTGFTVHREIELYTLAGIPVADALRIAAWNPIEYMGYSDTLGSIETGKLADFILLSGNPLEDINAIRAPRMVVRNGDVYFPSEIYEALSVKPFASPPEQLRAGPEVVAEPAAAEASPDAAPDAPSMVEHYPMIVEGLPIKAEDLPFSGAVRVGNIIYLSGQIGGAEGGRSSDFRDHAVEVMDSVRQVAASAGADMDQIFKCTVMLEDMSNWPAFNEVYAGYFTKGRMPARSAFGADGLALGASVEVECMAYAENP